MSDRDPALLVSFVYLDSFLRTRHLYAYRDWALDSGAFSAQNSGTPIDLATYTEKCRALLASDPALVEVFALDVIGDADASRRNCAAMWEAGIPAIPCYHYGEPEAALLALREFPKIALGGTVGVPAREKLRWQQQCFARVWPKQIHGFGCGSAATLLALPFHSVDATNWEVGPCKFGNWRQFGKMSVRGSEQNLRGEIEYYLDVEARARARWRREMASLDTAGPIVRLAADFGAANGRRIAETLAPTVRLACSYGQAERNGTLMRRETP